MLQNAPHQAAGGGIADLPLSLSLPPSLSLSLSLPPSLSLSPPLSLPLGILYFRDPRPRDSLFQRPQAYGFSISEAPGLGILYFRDRRPRDSLFKKPQA